MLRAASCLAGVLSLALRLAPPARGQEVRDTILEQRIAECAREQDGACLVAIAAFDEAATAFEESSRRLGQGEMAEDALLNAMRLHRELGQLDRSDRDARDFLGRFRGSARLAEAAQEALRAAMARDSPDDRAKAGECYEAFLRDFGSLGGWDLYLVAHEKLGELRMKQSCPISDYFGACVEFSLVRTECLRSDDLYARTLHEPRLYWGEVAQRHPRSPARLHEAKKHLRRALDPHTLSMAEQDAAGSPARMRMLANARAEALSLLATEDLDAYLGLGDVPVDLDFNQPTEYDNPCEQRRKKALYERSSRRFMQWLDAKVTGVERLRREYQQAIARGGPEASLAAAARFALVVKRAGDSLYASGDEELSCFREGGGLAEKVSPLVANAVAAGLRCDQLATLFGIGGEWAGYCRWLLAREAPSDFPPMSEVFPPASAMSLAREDPEFQQAQILRVDAPPRLRPRAPQRRCPKKAAGRVGGAILGTLRMQEGKDLAPLFGRDTDDQQRLAYPASFLAELARRFPPPWPSAR
jgi:hypothetical protein